MSKLILIVEDTLDLLENIIETLKMESYEVLSAANGKEALILLNKSNPDLIITDLMMPEMNGFDFIRQVRKNVHWNKIPILVFSAMPPLENERIVMASGANSFLKKPCTMEGFLEAVSNLTK